MAQFNMISIFSLFIFSHTMDSIKLEFEAIRDVIKSFLLKIKRIISIVMFIVKGEFIKPRVALSFIRDNEKIISYIW